jgi:hypothetical protein
VLGIAPELLFKFVPKVKRLTCNMYVHKFPEEDKCFKSYQVIVAGEVTVGDKNWLTKYPSSSYFLELKIFPQYIDSIQCDFDDNGNELELEY